MGAQGRYFEDFAQGEEIRHALPRTVTEGDAALYTALTGARFPLHAADTFARALGYDRAPADDLLVFHVAFGKTVPDVSRNAVANLGYAGLRFGAPVYPGDTLSARTRVIGLKQNSNGKTGVVYVHGTAENQDGAMVMDWRRWVMVAKRDVSAPAPEPVIPNLPEAVPVSDIVVPEGVHARGYDTGASGCARLWDDYAVGERIDHVDGMTVEEAEHMMATRLYHNTARVHFDQHMQASSRHGRRLAYGGHVISVARALSINGLANAFRLVAVNGGRHVSPVFGGDTLYAWSEVLDRLEIPGRDDLAALRLRTVATKNQAATDFPDKAEDGRDHPAVVLDLDYTVLMPRGASAR